MPPPAMNRVAPMPPAYELMPMDAPPSYTPGNPPTYDESEGRHDARVVRYERLDSPFYRDSSTNTLTAVQTVASRTCTNAYVVLTTLGAGAMLLSIPTAAGVYYGGWLDAERTRSKFVPNSWDKAQTGVIALATVTGLALFSIGLIMTVIGAKCLRKRCARSWHA